MIAICSVFGSSHKIFVSHHPLWEAFLSPLIPFCSFGGVWMIRGLGNVILLFDLSEGVIPPDAMGSPDEGGVSWEVYGDIRRKKVFTLWHSSITISMLMLPHELSPSASSPVCFLFSPLSSFALNNNIPSLCVLLVFIHIASLPSPSIAGAVKVLIYLGLCSFLLQPHFKNVSSFNFLIFGNRERQGL